MKKFIVLPLSVSISILLFSSCLSTTSAKDNTEEQTISKENYEYGEIVGIVEVSGENIYIVVNPDCKCRSSYLVKGEYADKIKEYEGKNVSAKGYIKRYTPWSAEIIVEKFIVIEKK